MEGGIRKEGRLKREGQERGVKELHEGGGEEEGMSLGMDESRCG
jgi:hypothetical protein